MGSTLPLQILGFLICHILETLCFNILQIYEPRAFTFTNFHSLNILGFQHQTTILMISGQVKALRWIGEGLLTGFRWLLNVR